MPSEISFWDTRFRNARVDKKHSWGVFEDGHLVGFIMNGVDLDNGKHTAYNTGTGVISSFRGQQLVDKMYEYGIPKLVEDGITRCTLEVIDKNERAIRVYERIGFEITKRLKCYKGTIQQKGLASVTEIDINRITENNNDKLYSWDNKLKTVLKAGETYKTYVVFDLKDFDPQGSFIINPDTGYIAQLGVNDEKWGILFDGISQISKEIRINNVHESRKDLINYLNDIGIKNTIDQFEMEMNF